jgi:hypothetical protein
MIYYPSWKITINYYSLEEIGGVMEPSMEDVQIIFAMVLQTARALTKLNVIALQMPLPAKVLLMESLPIQAAYN